MNTKTIEELTVEELTIMGRRYDHIQNEDGEGYNPYWKELERRSAADQRPARVATTWTREDVITIRSAWNKRVTDLEFHRGGKMDSLLVIKAQHEQGWTTDELRDAIAKFGL